ncbi:MAG: hypothetical protein Q9219_006961 [cf. Caloplaca sp. 3 TL-2023]
MHEILTLQLGHRANYLATHFWNAQESYFSYDTGSEDPSVDHNIHFRPGKGPSGEDTFTPRTLIYDLKGGFGSLRKWGGLYDQGRVDDNLKDLWDGSVVKQQDTPITQSEYQKALDQGIEEPPKLNTHTVRYWSDFARVFYHPRSIIQINDYELGSTILPFERWGSGEVLFSDLDKNHDLLDRDVRPWAEECDQMQGIQIFASSDDAWGGFAAKYMESLRDEYSKTSLWFWGQEDDVGQTSKAKQMLRTTNIAQSLQTIASMASMYVPLTVPKYLPPYVRLDLSSQWHIAALFSMAVESMTLPTRQRSGSLKRGSLSDLEAVLNVNGNQRIADLQCSNFEPSLQHPTTEKASGAANDSRTPLHHSRGVMYEDEAEAERADSKLDMTFTTADPSQTALSLRQWEKANHVFGKVESIRGVPSPERATDEEDEALSRKRRRLASLPIVERYHNSLVYPLLDSFPEILTESVSSTNATAVQTSLSTTTQISKRAKSLQNIISRMTGLMDREALSNGLGEIAEEYEEGWDSGSDEDSD